MVTTLNEQQQAKIHEILGHQRFASADEVIDEALEMLLDQQKLEHLRAVLKERQEEVAQGKFRETTPTFLEEVKAKARAMRQRGERPNPDCIP